MDGAIQMHGDHATHATTMANVRKNAPGCSKPSNASSSKPRNEYDYSHGACAPIFGTNDVGDIGIVEGVRPSDTFYAYNVTDPSCLFVTKMAGNNAIVHCFALQQKSGIAEKLEGRTLHPHRVSAARFEHSNKAKRFEGSPCVYLHILCRWKVGDWVREVWYQQENLIPEKAWSILPSAFVTAFHFIFHVMYRWVVLKNTGETRESMNTTQKHGARLPLTASFLTSHLATTQNYSQQSAMLSKQTA